MIKVLLYIWTLPQNILGLLVILFTRAKKGSRDYEYLSSISPAFGVSLGNYIIFGRGQGTTIDYLHEYGHHKQSLYLGWFYLFIVGLPSLLGNIWDRIAHKKWSHKKREQWYYSRFPENWADNLGLVTRSNK